MVWAVSALCLISTFHGLDYRVPKTVNKILFSGEVMPIKHLNKWMEALPKATFVNVYGPTEITCNCTYHVIDRNREYDKYIPIGEAFENERVFLLDDNDKLITEPNVKGEICVSGTCLALGYFNNKEETDKHFVQNPLNKNYIELIYRTGDLGMYNEQNELVFQGRKDFQIKYNGHRIELEEIEKAMMKVEGIERACCLFDEEKQKLYGFYVGTMDKAELHSSLKETLPVYMIPGILKQVEEMPLTKNGKIDRKELMSLVVKKND
ncbi:MAG: AMP-binding protein, partial [Bacilli bacterium]|nr:AMP-binding protein [Bacilli bacterium]